MRNHRRNPKNRQDSRRNGHPVHIGAQTDAIVERVRFQRNVEKLHRLGVRPVLELLREIGVHRNCSRYIQQRTERYAAISVADLDALDAREIPKPPVHGVQI
jgi:hypothetical protein